MNPYADKNGKPKKGLLVDFLRWEEEQTRKKVEKMSPKRRNEHRAAVARLDERMNH
jgi:hypothetical protein